MPSVSKVLAVVRSPVQAVSVPCARNRCFRIDYE